MLEDENVCKDIQKNMSKQRLQLVEKGKGQEEKLSEQIINEYSVSS